MLKTCTLKRIQHIIQRFDMQKLGWAVDLLNPSYSIIQQYLEVLSCRYPDGGVLAAVLVDDKSRMSFMRRSTATETTDDGTETVRADKTIIVGRRQQRFPLQISIPGYIIII